MGLIVVQRCMKKITTTIIGLVLSFSFMEIKAQEEFVDPPSIDLTTIPFTQLTGGIVIVRALLDSFPDTLNFILDTGSSGISLDSTTADYLNLQPEPSDRTIKGIAGIKRVSFLYNRTLHFPGLSIDSLNFHINDYSILLAVYGVRVDGIIGYGMLSRYIVKVNYDRMRITIASNGSIRYPRGGYLLKPYMTTLVVQPIDVRDAATLRSNFLFDMGAGLCMMLTKDFVEDSFFLNKKTKAYTKEGEGLGGKIDMQLRVIKEVKIGPYRFKRVPVYVFDDEYNVTSYPYMSGILGNELLRRFNVTLNYAQGDIYLLPNTHMRDFFDYSYSGLELYYIEGLIVAGDVAKGSPAEEAGVKEGDIVIAVNRDLSQNLDRYKRELQNTLGKVQLLLKRNGEIIRTEFKVKNILK